MGKTNRFNEFDGYGSKGKYKGKGHQSRGKSKRELNENWDEDEAIENLEKIFNDIKASQNNIKTSVQPQPQPQPQPIQNSTVVLSEQYTQEIKGYKIDFSRLASIDPIDQEHNGKQTFGIKFVFAGKKGFFRIVWFNTNKNLRDQTLTEKLVYWNTVKQQLTKQ